MTSIHNFLPAALALFLTAAPLAAGPTDFGPGTQVGRVDGLPPLPSNVRSAYRQFIRDSSYFAAFAVNFDTGDWFYMRNLHSAGTARAAALEGCRFYANGADGCVIYAVAMPETLPVDQPNASGMSRAASDAYHTVYQEYRKPGTYTAFAISGANHFGFANAAASAAEAKDTALAYCQKGVARDMADFGPVGRKFARDRSLQDCRVVEVTRTANK